MTKREMVEVVLYKDGTYEVNSGPSDYATQKVYGFCNGKSCYIYYCKKEKWKIYLMRLINEMLKDTEKEIKKWNKIKRDAEKVKKKLQED